MNRENIALWEILDPTDSGLTEAQRLYETTQAIAERIPWAWIARAPSRRQSWRPGQWSPHLLLAALQHGKNIDPPAGFIHGAHVPGYGGYVCYLGVDPTARKSGMGTRLFEQMFRVMTVDAGFEGVPLPFVIWESRRPADDAPKSAWNLWSARMRLFAKVGGLWIDGVTFHSPDHSDPSETVPLQLFLRPFDLPASAFDAPKLREIVAGLQVQVYGNSPGDPLFDATLPMGCKPRLRSALDADRVLVA